MADKTRSFSNLNLPWFLYDIQNKQLITNNAIPGDITDTKQIVLAEVPIPGLNFNPINSGGFGNRKIAFTIPLIKRNNTVGNVFLVKQFENLRNQSYGINPANIFKSATQFVPNPKVLFYWGSSNSIPLEWYVAKCDFIHKSSFTNRFGNTQYTEISMELWLDETSRLFKAEEIFRKISSYAGSIEGAFNIGKAASGGGLF